MAKDTPELAVVQDDRLIVRFTSEEAQVLINMINIAVMSRGLEAAAAGVVLAARLQEAMK